MISRFNVTVMYLGRVIDSRILNVTALGPTADPSHIDMEGIGLSGGEFFETHEITVLTGSLVQSLSLSFFDIDHNVTFTSLYDTYSLCYIAPSLPFGLII